MIFITRDHATLIKWVLLETFHITRGGTKVLRVGAVTLQEGGAGK